MIIIENENIKAIFSAKGAELQSLFSKQNGIEYMWDGDADFWAKHSPVLFPIVGALKDDTYYYRQKAYQLPRHGFAREKFFLQEQVSSDEVIFTLTHDEDTLKVYPFAFTLKLIYKLQKNALSCTYEVSNTGYNGLLFSIGGHPAFAVPMIAGTRYTDYYLQFDKTELLHRWKLQNGLIDTFSENLPLVNNTLQLEHRLFYEDAIVLKNIMSNEITLSSNIHQHGLKFNFDNFPFLGIWAARDANFICLEPWCGIADSVTSNQQLTDKEGIINLAANAYWQRTWAVECF